MHLIKYSTKFAVSTLALILLGCSVLNTAHQEQLLKKVVNQYNNLLIEANKSRDVSPLDNIADDNVVRKLYLWMAAWEDGNVYLDAELKKLDFVDFKIAGEKVDVTTYENWNYIYRDLNTQEIAEPSRSISYKMKYSLEKREGQWLITDINILRET
jgi:hypothetical protein